MRLIKGRKGVTLVEVMIATLLSAIIISGVLISVLSSRTALARSDNKTQALAYLEKVADNLSNYVTADRTGNTAAYAPNANWDITGGSGCGSGWALQEGCDHTAQSLLPPEFTLPPYNGQVVYRITDMPDGSKRVILTATWEEP